MTHLSYHPIATPIVAALREGGPDAYGVTPEHAISDAASNPCRHCLNDIAQVAGMLIFAHRPFERLHAYAETGPVFLCADACAAYRGKTPPPILTTRPEYLLKGYTNDERIRYGTDKIVCSADVTTYATQVLKQSEVAFIDVRSARNNCFQLRITQA
ncbi:DUF1203 domain-containing protein [Sulfitobacter sp.]|uniref:DUF1203 domain-containing protein n=1 Tax=Sulfitobacter sp. TaxID=1903071 RepID=UPI0030028A15